MKFPKVRPEITAIKKAGFDVKEFTYCHVRVAGRFDVYPSETRMHWAWFDLVTGTRGVTPAIELPVFIRTFLDEHPKLIPKAPPQSAPRGWWWCPVPACLFKMPDDGTAEATHRMYLHLETHPDTPSARDRS